MKRSALIRAISAALLGASLGGLAGCNEDKGQFLGNMPPSVQLTATPPDSGISRYDVEFHWTGWDSDGEVDYFLYAIDPPDMFGTEDSIWTRTDTYSGRFIFTASDFDTLYPPKHLQVAKGWHVFVIKAVDDMGAVSAPEYLAFNAATIAPQTTFTAPPPFGGVEQYQGGPQQVGLRVTFRWEGTDIDGLYTDTPVGYYLKATDVSGESSWGNIAPRVWRDTTAWSHIGPGTTKVTLKLDDRHAYGVAIRAIDEAGAIEPVLLLNKNMLWVAATEMNSSPELTVHSTPFGLRTWQGWTQDAELYDVPLGNICEFTISGDAGWYGGLITGYSFGWDLERLDTADTAPDGIGAWTPWSPSRNIITAAFNEVRDYFLYIRCKDDGGSMTLATIQFNVVTLNPTKNLGFVDDWRKYPKLSPTGEALDDGVWQAMLEGYNYDEDWNDIVWDEWDAPYGEEVPSLEFLSQFRVLVWSLNDNRSMALNQKSAWFQMNYLNTMHLLSIYMGSETGDGEKGKVWAYGRGVVESSVLPYGGGMCEYPYEVDAHARLGACGIRRTAFAYNRLHIIGDFNIFDHGSGGARVNLFDMLTDKPTHVFVDTAGPAIADDRYTRPPAAELYPKLPPRLELHLDRANRSKIAFFEVLEFPKPDQENQDLFYDPLSEQMTDLVPLYRYNAFSPVSEAHNMYCGFRYIPTRSSDHGEIVYFFFPMFPFKDDQIRATAKVVLSDWFGLPDPDVRRAGAGPSGP